MLVLKYFIIMCHVQDDPLRQTRCNTSTTHFGIESKHLTFYLEETLTSESSSEKKRRTVGCILTPLNTVLD